MPQVRNEDEKIREGGGAKAVESQHKKARLTARERIKHCWSTPVLSSSSASMPLTGCMKIGEARRLRA